METIIPFPISVKPLKEHNELKQKILDAIQRQENAEHMTAPDSDIIKCDWNTARYDGDREWLKLINPFLSVHLD